MVPRRKNIHILSRAVKAEHPGWNDLVCLTEAKRLWDGLYNQQKQFAQVRANRLKKPFLLISNTVGGVDCVAADAHIDTDQEIYLVINPEFKKPEVAYA